MRVPETAGSGKATIALSFDSWKEGKVAPSRHEIEVVDAGPRPKLEAVSSRLKGTLTFPDRNAVVQTVRFSPDGKRLLAGAYPDGTVQLWDVETGKQPVKIETGRRQRSEEFFFVTPDWKTLYAPRQTKPKAERFERDGKKMTRWECAGEVRAWDLQTGEQKETFAHSPPRGIFHMDFSPEGSWFVTREELSGESEGRLKYSVTRWDVRTKSGREMADSVGGSAFSADGKVLAVARHDEVPRYVRAIRLLDSETLKETRSIPLAEKHVFSGVWTFTPAGDLLIGFVRDFPEERDYKTFQDHLKFWDARSGKELASFQMEEKKGGFLWPTLSPDGRTLAATNWQGEKAKLYLFDVAAPKLRKTVPLADNCNVSQPVFSPDGQWLALQTQARSEDRDVTDPELLPQPRIHLIDVLSGEVRETLIAPPSFLTGACFSPDGKTLATGGHGKVLLWRLGD